jgi:Protein of unknown function (DUF4241)
MSTTLTGLTYAGSFAVDSGQAMVGDPCYLNDYDPNTNEAWDLAGKEGQYSYQGISAVTLNKNFGEIAGNTAVAFSTGYGDGLYPVYVKLDQDNRVVMVVIDFNGELEDDWEKE